MPDIDAVKQECFVATKEMLACANSQRCDTPERVEETKVFLEILQTLYKEQLDTLKLIKEAGDILNSKLKSYANRKEIFRAGPAESLDDL
jgi:hypothetical protein